MHVKVERVGDIFFQCKRRRLYLSICEFRVPAVIAYVYRDVVNSILASVSCLSLILAFLWIASILPSGCPQVDFLSLLGRDREFVIGAGALASVTLSSVRFGVFKYQESGFAHALSVQVD